MNDSPGWATPGPSSSEGDGDGGNHAGQDGQGANDGTRPPAQPAGDPKWSASQPPPGQWADPGTAAPGPTPPPPPQPPQGAGWGPYGQQQGPQQYGSPYGGQYGNQYGGGPYGAAPWGTPPAAKPGVIPLRPLGLGEILDGAVTTLRTHWRSVLSVSIVVAVIVEVGRVLLQKYAFADLTAAATGPDADPEKVFDSLGNTLLISSAGGFLQLVIGVIASALLTVIYSRAVIGRASSVGDAWREARSRVLPLAGLTLLLGLGALAVLGLLLAPGLATGNAGLTALGALAAAPLVVWLWFRFALSSPALMLEKAGVITALKRSDKLVKGSWWRIFGITLLTGLITFLVSMVIAIPFAIIAMIASPGGLSGLADGTAAQSWTFLITTGIGTIISLALVMPIQAGVTVLLYIDQRIRREALDLELARAAGLENYGG